MNKKIKIAFASMLAVPLLACAQVRTEQTFEKGWKFTREDSKDFSNSTYDDAKWQSVRMIGLFTDHSVLIMINRT